MLRYLLFYIVEDGYSKRKRIIICVCDKVYKLEVLDIGVRDVDFVLKIWCVCFLKSEWNRIVYVFLMFIFGIYFLRGKYVCINVYIWMFRVVLCMIVIM